MWFGDDGRAGTDELREEPVGVVVPEHELSGVAAEMGGESVVCRRLVDVNDAQLKVLCVGST